MRKTYNAPRSPASAAVIALREAMGMTQQRFAVEALEGAALYTVGRYETTNPPRGGALLRLGAVAQAAADKIAPEDRKIAGSFEKLTELANRFRFLYIDEVLRDLFPALEGAAGNRSMTMVPSRGEGWFLLRTDDLSADAEDIKSLMNRIHARMLGTTEEASARALELASKLAGSAKSRRARNTK